MLRGAPELLQRLISYLSTQGGGGVPGFDSMPLPLSLTPQNYRESKIWPCAAVTRVWCTLHVGGVGRSLAGPPYPRVWALCQDVFGLCNRLDEPVSALLAPKGVDWRGFCPSRGRFGYSRVGWCTGQLDTLECHRQ
jgi:hypothetical protein